MPQESAQTFTELGPAIPAQLLRHLLTDKTKAEGLLKAKNQLDEDQGNHQPPAATPLAHREKRKLTLTPNEHGIEVMHADINGALNIIRKVCPWLKFDAKLTSLKYRIWFVVNSKLRLRKSPRKSDPYTKEVASLGFIMKQALQIFNRESLTSYSYQRYWAVFSKYAIALLKSSAFIFSP